MRRDFAYLVRTSGAVAAHDRSETVARAHGRTAQRTCTIAGVANVIRDALEPNCLPPPRELDPPKGAW